MIWPMPGLHLIQSLLRTKNYIYLWNFGLNISDKLTSDFFNV